MSRKKLTVHKKGFTGHRDHHAYHVKPSTFKITDRGNVGRGKKVVQIKHKGELGGKGFFSKPVHERRAVYKHLAHKKGEKHVVGQLRAIQVFNKNVNPSLAEKARADSHWVAGEFMGKKDVGYPAGFNLKVASKRKLSQMA